MTQANQNKTNANLAIHRSLFALGFEKHPDHREFCRHPCMSNKPPPHIETPPYRRDMRRYVLWRPMLSVDLCLMWTYRSHVAWDYRYTCVGVNHLILKPLPVRHNVMLWRSSRTNAWDMSYGGPHGLMPNMDISESRRLGMGSGVRPIGHTNAYAEICRDTDTLVSVACVFQVSS